ncbi:MAG: hypothetical protein KZQ58_11450 [gamma proteobacterium symbiont of Bathyaustriella thionipta]|nr:hypothetical protein [gamma proteobacterium symbiont of Bathyaustriella thionipta]
MKRPARLLSVLLMLLMAFLPLQGFTAPFSSLLQHSVEQSRASAHSDGDHSAVPMMPEHCHCCDHAGDRCSQSSCDCGIHAPGAVIPDTVQLTDSRFIFLHYRRLHISSFSNISNPLLRPPA